VRFFVGRGGPNEDVARLGGFGLCAGGYCKPQPVAFVASAPNRQRRSRPSCAAVPSRVNPQPFWRSYPARSPGLARARGGAGRCE
jgi:hypothetical protein